MSCREIDKLKLADYADEIGRGNSVKGSIFMVQYFCGFLSIEINYEKMFFCMWCARMPRIYDNEIMIIIIVGSELTKCEK